MNRGEASYNVVHEGDDLGELLFLLLNVGEARRADVGSCSVGLVVGLLVTFPKVSLSPVLSFSFGEVGLDLDGLSQDPVPGSKGTSVFGPIRTNRGRVSQPGDDRSTVSYNVSAERARVGVPAEAKVGEFKSDGFSADG
jgi:hypothetical protein